jgi:ubiquinone/menaquinone biosynthesis C-methylase UbiE
MSRLGRTGDLGIAYAIGRERKVSLRYRYNRRAKETIASIEEFLKYSPHDIIDLGTAEGRLLDRIQARYPQARCVGVEYNEELVQYGKKLFPLLELINGDVQAVNFTENSFDVAIATAVIEHVPEPSRLLAEARRILRKGGLLIISSPAPFWERVATAVGHLDDDQHNHVMGMNELQGLITENGFSILKAEKFMLSPVGMPFESAVESFIRAAQCDFLLANQLVVAGSL